MSQRGESLGEGRRRGKRGCFPARLLARWTRWSQAEQRAASSAGQNTDASSLLQTSQMIFMLLATVLFPDVLTNFYNWIMDEKVTNIPLEILTRSCLVVEIMVV